MLTTLQNIPGIATIDPRIVRDVIVARPGSLPPVSARIVSLTNSGDESLSRLYIRRGEARKLQRHLDPTLVLAGDLTLAEQNQRLA